MPGSTDKLADLKRQNQALQARLALYESALEHMHQGLCVFDPDGRIALCNHRFAEVIQLPVEQVSAGLTLRELVSRSQAAGHYPSDASPERLEQQLWDNLAASADVRSRLERGGRTFAVRQASE